MTEDESKAVQFVVSNLILTLEKALLRVQAYRDAAQKHAPAIIGAVEYHETDLKGSLLESQYNELRNQAVAAVRDQDWSALSESTGDLTGRTREFLDRDYS
jgi:hypothetical protein